MCSQDHPFNHLQQGESSVNEFNYVLYFPQSGEVIGQYECNKSEEIAHFDGSHLIFVCPCMLINVYRLYNT